MIFTSERVTPESNLFCISVIFYHYDDTYNSHETLKFFSNSFVDLEALLLVIKEHSNRNEESFKFKYINNNGEDDLVIFYCPWDSFCDGSWYCKVEVGSINYYDSVGEQFKIEFTED